MELFKVILGPAVTFFVGLVAFMIYHLQNEDKKRNAAKLILQEIRYAEQIIRSARTQAVGNFNFSERLLPTSSWHENIHLFVTHLKESQMDLISRFYSKAEYLDVLVRASSDAQCAPNIAVPIPQPPPYVASGNPENGMPNQQPSFSLAIPPGFAINQILRIVTNEIVLIYNTPAVEKLIEISEKKIYWFF